MNSNRTERLARARANLDDRTVLRAINDISTMDWVIIPDDPDTGPFTLVLGHELHRWRFDAMPRFHRDVARHLALDALGRACARLTPESLRHYPGGSPWHAETDDAHHERMDSLRGRMVKRVLGALRNDGVYGVIAMATGQTVEDVEAQFSRGPTLSSDEIEALLAEIDADVIVLSDKLAADLIDREVPTASTLKKAASKVRSWSWEVVPTRLGRWAVRGGKQFNAALKAPKDGDEAGMARTLIARAVKFLVPRMTLEITTIKQELSRFEADDAIHQLVCDRLRDSVRVDGYGGFGRMLAAY